MLKKQFKKDTQLVTYQFGGQDESLMVSPPLSVGYPAYQPGNPAEVTFTITITKIVAGAAGTRWHADRQRQSGHVQFHKP